MSSEPLAQWHGRHVLGFQDCILKGILEADAKVQRLYVTEDRPFGQLVRVLARPGVQTELNRHEVVAIRGGTVGSHLDRAAADAKFGRGAVVPFHKQVLLPNCPYFRKSQLCGCRLHWCCWSKIALDPAVFLFPAAPFVSSTCAP